MSSNNNGFADMSKHFGKLVKVDVEKISLDSLQEAAEYYVEKMIPNIPVSLMKKKHAKDHIKVEIQDEQVAVIFEDTAFYWRFIENGTVNLKAQHFASGTWEQNQEKIQDIMTKKLIEELG
ncbi:hypothetical protein CAT7_07448 [Carnobacterium sp. AT7]|uniref:HK97-gp10 family putative phage morphogenesis protein n=1 Tax=Carnobacterium sp. AT7 TaxID=333990 RepID=UPI00015F013A|nr:HK97-gp10 family putative phage morphogenesis protein [Carnobacterium sp. AT7]EDP67308.1 hypothetical protein CAT7_07448 [Carnobacterium sp. AT7]